MSPSAKSRGKKVTASQEPVKKAAVGKQLLAIFGTGARDSHQRLDGRKDTITIFVDAGSELRKKGLMPDCLRVFDLDYYLTDDCVTYGDLEVYIQGDPTFALKLDEAKAAIFAAIPEEQSGWEKLLRVHRDNLGGGGLVGYGTLRILAAMVGREYQPDKVLPNGEPNPRYDRRDDTELNPALKKRGTDVKTVSLYDDLWDVMDDEGVDFACWEGGFDGATGSSGTFVSSLVFGSSVQVSSMPTMAVALPEFFLVDGVIHPSHSDRLAQTISLFHKVCVIAGFGGEGIFWQAIADNMREWAGVYSNVDGIDYRRKQKSQPCSPVLLVGISTYRKDLEARWVIYNIVTKKMELEDVQRILRYYAGLIPNADGAKLDKPRIVFVPVKVGQKVYVRIETRTPEVWTIAEWEELTPALATAGRFLGSEDLKLPVEVEIESIVMVDGFWGKKPKKAYKKETQELPVETVPFLETIARGAGKDTLEQAAADLGFYALTAPEKELIRSHRGHTFDTCFTLADTHFKPTAREYLLNELFAYKISPPSSATYESPQTVVAWAQPALNAEDLADHIFGTMFAPVDRSGEEEAREAEEAERERVRRKAVQLERKQRVLR